MQEGNFFPFLGWQFFHGLSFLFWSKCPDFSSSFVFTISQRFVNKRLPETLPTLWYNCETIPSPIPANWHRNWGPNKEPIALWRCPWRCSGCSVLSKQSENSVYIYDRWYVGSLSLSLSMTIRNIMYILGIGPLRVSNGIGEEGQTQYWWSLGGWK